MHLAHVRLVNFRNFVDFKATLSPGLNVIVGENNVGKTNLLDAIRLALGATSSTDPVRPTREDRHRLPDGSYVDKPIEIALTFASLSPEEQAEFIDILDIDVTDPTKSTAEIRYIWSWPDKAKRWTARRIAGGRSNTESAVPDELLQAMPVTMLGALRDAVVALSPGRLSRLGQLMRATASDKQHADLEAAMKVANDALEANGLIKSVEATLHATLHGATGPKLCQSALIRASEPQFERIVANLRLVLNEGGRTPTGSPVVSELRVNGLGYNNLLYIATAIAELDVAKNSALPLLFVEEPEAHLHPQLQTLLADFLATGGTAGTHKTRVQAIVTTHSPTLASHVQPNQIHVFHRSAGATRCASISACGLTASESSQLRRMFDVTKATLLFGRGVILVEGVTEALLLPPLARRLGVSIAHAGVSIVPLSGVDFASIAKLFGADKIAVPLAIVTDADPQVRKAGDDEFPFDEQGRSTECPRVATLRTRFAANTSVAVFASNVTLEYDLALASDANALCLFDAWLSCYERSPRTLKRADLENAPDSATRALLLWRALCRGTPLHGKAELAQALAAALDDRRADGTYKHAFIVPDYIQRAIRHALGAQPTVMDAHTTNGAL
jgi:putative ATP-dependent endonuclease of OLD family